MAKGITAIKLNNNVVANNIFTTFMINLLCVFNVVIESPKYKLQKYLQLQNINYVLIKVY